MKRSAILVLSISVLAAGCGKDDKGKAPGKQPPKPAEASAAADKAAAKPQTKAPPPAPRDPRIAEIFAAGKDCAPGEQRFARCVSADKIAKLAFENQSDDKLAASCVGALRDPDPSTRVLAAECMKGFNDRARIPHLAAGLDAFEAEKDAKVRDIIACAFSNGNARESGVEDRVIALVRKLAANPSDDRAAGCLLGSMFPQYLFGKTDPPSKAAGDLALEMARKTGSVQTRALAAVALLTDRRAEVCEALAEIVGSSGDRWGPVVEAIAKVGDACVANLEPVIDALAKAMAEGRYDAWGYQATKQLLDNIPLGTAQVAKLAPAAKKLAKQATGFNADKAKEIAARLRKYQPPAPKE